MCLRSILLILISSCSVLNGKKTDKEKITREKKIEVSVIDKFGKQKISGAVVFFSEGDVNKITD